MDVKMMMLNDDDENFLLYSLEMVLDIPDFQTRFRVSDRNMISVHG